MRQIQNNEAFTLTFNLSGVSSRVSINYVNKKEAAEMRLIVNIQYDDNLALPNYFR